MRLAHSAAFAAALAAASLGAPRAALAQAPNPSFYLVNKANEAIADVFATPAGMENWGKSRNEGHSIAPGARYAVRLRADGNCVYDLKITFASGKSETRRHLDTCKTDDVTVGLAGDATQNATPSAGGHDASFRLINNGASDIVEVHATPANADKVADNLLRDGATLAPRASQLFHMPATQGCSYDLRVVFADKKSREKKDADLCKITDLPVQ